MTAKKICDGIKKIYQPQGSNCAIYKVKPQHSWTGSIHANCCLKGTHENGKNQIVTVFLHV